MPLYEYHCDSCGKKFEKLRDRKQSESAPCPDCGTAASKVLSAFAVSISGGSGCSVSPSSPACGTGG
ncbi:MAG: zinc ribbon domain-containing protein [Myxococcota bacterium]|nr:zinc ribbon domain-containing protein [Myxococcota bacterium]